MPGRAVAQATGAGATTSGATGSAGGAGSAPSPEETTSVTRSPNSSSITTTSPRAIGLPCAHEHDGDRGHVEHHHDVGALHRRAHGDADDRDDDADGGTALHAWSLSSVDLFAATPAVAGGATHEREGVARTPRVARHRVQHGG